MTFKELRVPQDAFCGSYFSASMPGQVVKEAMQNPAMMVCVCVCVSVCVYTHRVYVSSTYLYPGAQDRLPLTSFL